MTQPSGGPAATGVPICYRHPGRETGIRCQRCDRPICTDCMNDAAVGFQCPECLRRGAKETRQGRALYGGRRSRDPRLTSYVLVGINAAVWLAIVATGAMRSLLVEPLSLIPRGRCGSISAPATYYPSVTAEEQCRGANGGDGTWIAGVADGAVWQLLTSAFTHVEIWHLLLNLIALAVLGPWAERIFGRARFLAIYLLSALGGSAAVMWLSEPTGSTVGASGVVFGILGALLVSYTKARRDSQWVRMDIILGMVFALGLMSFVGGRQISWQGHLGGLLAGAAAAAIVAYAPKQRRSLLQWIGLSLLAALLLGVSLFSAAVLA